MSNTEQYNGRAGSDGILFSGAGEFEALSEDQPVPSVAQARAIVNEWKGRDGTLLNPFVQATKPRTFSDDELMARAFGFIAAYRVEAGRLELLRQSVDMGLVRTLRARIAHWDAFLSASPLSDVQNELLLFKETLSQMERLEADHGVGAPLNLQHPIVKSLARTRESWVGPREIAKAKAYRKDNGGV
jgi:hypothetical protein